MSIVFKIRFHQLPISFVWTTVHSRGVNTLTAHSTVEAPSLNNTLSWLMSASKDWAEEIREGHCCFDLFEDINFTISLQAESLNLSRTGEFCVGRKERPERKFYSFASNLIDEMIDEWRELYAKLPLDYDDAIDG